MYILTIIIYVIQITDKKLLYLRKSNDGNKHNGNSIKTAIAAIVTHLHVYSLSSYQNKLSLITIKHAIKLPNVYISYITTTIIDIALFLKSLLQTSV